MTASNTIIFTRGVPPIESFPTQRLETCAQTVLEQDGSRLLQYGKAAGYEPLRARLAEQYHTAAERVIVGQGSLQLLDTLVRVTLSPQDCVLLEQPTYDRVLTIFRRSGTQLTGIDLHNGLLDVGQLEANLKVGLRPRYFYTIPDFQNPSGAVMPLETRHRLIALSEQYGFTLIEDGPYRDLRYHGQALPSLLSLAPERVIFMSSYSKLISPGLRVGFMILPPELAARVRKFAEDTYINASYLNQAIAFEFIQRGWLDENLELLKDLYRPRLDSLLAALEEEFSGKAEWVKPQGGFFVGLNLAEGSRAPERAAQQAAGLMLSDSRGFFIDGGQRFIRLPFCALTPEQIQEGVRRLAGIVIK
ncbi:MAG: 2-aminoadipate transaminase [Chloroflexota bacterium]|nr:2-aminoadipate transaminase [Chloroflexota bacterium]